MKAIVAVDLNWGIGYKGNLLKRISPDMKRFKEITINKVVVMGRKTFESLPKKEPLKDRVNIVLSKSGSINHEKVIVCRSLNQLFNELLKYNTDNVFLMGGESVYELLLPYCTEAYVTKIKNTYTADKYFVNLDENDSWKLIDKSDLQIYDDVEFYYTKYAK
ncbi:dihydrofolate reductase [Herbivorax sp. ANBcel31]|uniref:dihydrofolate reductase n=1 Tax=Herbivorax sp. ANBcel31 TaxID=3069754 RepID=UPI0027B82EEA|nr:dihydrofolate reductase [Herbivorax sp. ANBcel31]MDQ2088095.1 dihydrofolate reductase [Herbivorax sp. ANBcel31]